VRSDADTCGCTCSVNVIIDYNQFNYNSKVKVSKVILDICKVPSNTIAFSKALRYGNTQFYLQTSHNCLYSPSAEHHCPLAGTHFTVPRRVEDCVDLRGWLNSKIKCRTRESTMETVTHPSTNRAQRRLTSLIEIRDQRVTATPNCHRHVHVHADMSVPHVV